MDKYELQKIKIFAHGVFSSTPNPSHTWQHVQRVIKNAHWIIEKTGVKGIDGNLLDAACCLHDLPVILYAKGPLGLIAGHFLERKAISVELPKILDNFSLKEEERKILYTAIYNHPGSQEGKLNENGDDYSKILQDADTLDGISNERIQGYKTSKAAFYSKVVPAVSGPYLWLFRKYIRRFLNFPGLASELLF